MTGRTCSPAAVVQRLEVPDDSGGLRAVGDPIVLGRGRLVVASAGPAQPGTAVPRVVEGPLAIRARNGLRVSGPRLLAEFLVRRYAARALSSCTDDQASSWEQRNGSWLTVVVSDRSGSATFTTQPSADRSGETCAEVWIAPDGSAAVRSPFQLGDAWVSVALR